MPPRSSGSLNSPTANHIALLLITSMKRDHGPQSGNRGLPDPTQQLVGIGHADLGPYTSEHESDLIGGAGGINWNHHRPDVLEGIVGDDPLRPVGSY
jgi:hypothetical protein